MENCKQISVRTGTPYEITIARGLLEQAGERLAALKPDKAVIITDDTVNALYGKRLEQSLGRAGIAYGTLVFPHGEASKTLESAGKCYGFFARAGLTRSSLVIALGGGVPGDLAGFAAATYMRGVRYVQLPTTFLAAIDSSVGGKTAVDIPEGKNLVGAFWQPSAVLCDPDTLSTLPEDVFADGTAEALKYGAIFDETLFARLERGVPKEELPAIIAECVDWKRKVVEEDERDTGRRQLLNFGHTLGHAIEKESNFSMPHGRAVAVGMAEITRRTEARGLTEPGTAARIRNALNQCGLPSRFDGDFRGLLPAILSDKKRRGGTVTFIILERIGVSRLYDFPADHLDAFLTEER